MSENNVNGITGADVATTTGIVGATVAIGQYIINDYVITIAEAEGDYGYIMTITRGTETQTVTLYGLTQEQYEAMLGYLQQAQEAAQSAQTADRDAQAALSRALNAALAAADSESNAAEHASESLEQAGFALQSANDARAASIAAQSAQQQAQAAQTAAETAKNSAQTAQAAAEAARTAAETAETSAGTSASQASQSATNAAQSATDAQHVLDSIPADYTQMEADVADLKSHVDEIKIKATNPTSDYDLSFTDKYGKAIAIFYDGEIKTKDFDSSEIGDLSILQTEEKGTLVEAINDSLAGLKAENIVSVDDLSFMDKYGHAIMMLKNGGIKTLDFDSSAYPKTAIGNGWFTYQGKEISVVKNKCKLSSIFHLDGFTPSTLQGGAIYGDYYFQFDSGREHCAIYDITTHSLTQLYTFATHDNNWHCNNANFGNEFYDEDDLFPLLYVSQENLSVHNVHVLRVSGEIGSLEFTHVQTITWDDPEECETYYPNAIIDSENGIIYQTGYSINNYGRNPVTKIKVFGYPLPLLSAGDVALHTDDAINAFEIASFTALQGCVVQNGMIYMISGQYSERGIRAVNPCSGNVDSYINLDPLLTYLNANIEPESLACYDGCLVFVGTSKTMLKVEFGRENK